MIFLPVCLNITHARIAVIGGGKAAEQKLKTLLLYTNRIVVCAPKVRDTIRAMPVTILEKPYNQDVLEGINVVYACTDQEHVNRIIAADAHRRHILVCVTDSPESCDFISPAIHKKGFMSIAVSSNARDIRRSMAWRDRFADMIENDDD